MPSFQEESASISQPQAVQEREQVNDSLCALLDPLINRRSITEPRVNYRDVVDAIEQGATINVRCADGASPLHFAAAAHGLMVVELLISQEADVHAVNGAVTNASVDIVRSLLGAGAASTRSTKSVSPHSSARRTRAERL